MKVNWVRLLCRVTILLVLFFQAYSSLLLDVRSLVLCLIQGLCKYFSHERDAIQFSTDYQSYALLNPRVGSSHLLA